MLRVDVEAVQCKRRSLAYGRQSADMAARKLPLRNVSLHDVPGLKSQEHCLACAMCFWKAVLVGSAHLTRTMPHGSDLKRLNLRDLQVLRRAATNACGVDPMRLRRLQLCSIEFGQPTRPRFNRQIESLQAIEERPPCRIDGGGVFQGRLRLSFDRRKIDATQL